MLDSLPFLSNRLKPKRGHIFGALTVTALLAFEIFNFSTTDFALVDLIGEFTFLGIRWATILSIAFCGIDFAGIARLFTPEKGDNESMEVWYLFGAWMLAAVMNAMLTWWGVSIAIINHETLGSAVVAKETLMQVVPIFVAIMVWLIRVLIIGSMSIAGDRLFNLAAVSTKQHTAQSTNNFISERRPRSTAYNSMSVPGKLDSQRSTSRQNHRRSPNYKRRSAVEPEYTPLDSNQETASFSYKHRNKTNQIRF
jgi:hypothetical protein